MSVNQIFLLGLSFGLGCGALALSLCSVYSVTRKGLSEI